MSGGREVQVLDVDVRVTQGRQLDEAKESPSLQQIDIARAPLILLFVHDIFG